MITDTRNLVKLAMGTALAAAFGGGAAFAQEVTIVPGRRGDQWIQREEFQYSTLQQNWPEVPPPASEIPDWDSSIRLES